MHFNLFDRPFSGNPAIAHRENYKPVDVTLKKTFKTLAHIVYINALRNYATFVHQIFRFVLHYYGQQFISEMTIN